MAACSGDGKSEKADARSFPKDTAGYLTLPMTTDRRTEMYVKFAKVMLIFQGPPSDDKENALKLLKSKFKHSCCLLTDASFIQDTRSVFKPEETEEFHRYFQSKCKDACEDGYNLIVINQSMTNLRQINYYYYLADKMQYVFHVVPPLVLERDAKSQGPRKTHALAFEREFKVRIPHGNMFKHLFSAWFLHDVDSLQLRNEAALYIQDCIDGISEFAEMFSKFCFSKNFREYYNLDDQRQDLACCVVNIFEGISSAYSYFYQNETVRKFYGKMSKLYIVGFIISPHMIAARVKLTHEQKQLWTLRDDIEETDQVTAYPSELRKLTKVNLPKVDVRLISTKSNRTLVSTGHEIHNPTEFIPPYAKGKSCHIILGKSPNAPTANLNYDVSFALAREKRASKSDAAPMGLEDLERSVVKRIGKYWYIYLKEDLSIEAFFSSCCIGDAHDT